MRSTCEKTLQTKTHPQSGFRSGNPVWSIQSHRCLHITDGMAEGRGGGATLPQSHRTWEVEPKCGTQDPCPSSSPPMASVPLLPRGRAFPPLSSHLPGPHASSQPQPVSFGREASLTTVACARLRAPSSVLPDLIHWGISSRTSAL